MRTILAMAAAVALVSGAGAQDGVGARVVVDAAGAHLATETLPGAPAGGGGVAGTSGWSYTHVSSIPQTLGISSSSQRVWVGQWLNVERLQEFDLLGDGTPLEEFPAGPQSPVVTHAAEGADLAVLLDEVGGVLTLAAYTSASTMPEWTHTFPAGLTAGGFRAARVSRDGAIACALVNDQGAGTALLHIFDGATGALLDTWTDAGLATGIDLSDDGALCLVTQGSSGRLIDTTTGTDVFTAPGSGGGAWHRISGNGEVIALGGFSFHVYKKIGMAWTQVINFSAPNQWFGAGVGISRDGTTAAVASYTYTTYLQTTTRIIDVDTQTLLGQHATSGTGSLQDTVSGAEVSDDGSVVAVSSWGTQDNAHPEVMVFDRDAALVASIDTSGSVFSLDVSGDGLHVAAGSKSIHANIQGSGGTVTVLHLPAPCPWDLDGDGVIGILDFLDLLAQWGSDPGGPPDFDGDGTVGILDFLDLLAHWGDCP